MKGKALFQRMFLKHKPLFSAIIRIHVVIKATLLCCQAHFSLLFDLKNELRRLHSSFFSFGLRGGIAVCLGLASQSNGRTPTATAMTGLQSSSSATRHSIGVAATTMMMVLRG